MPKWIHDRAKYIRSKNPDLPEGAEWGIATQQGYATKKAPSDYGTKKGRQKAKKKYKKPAKEYEQKAKPKKKKKKAFLESLVVLANALDERGFEKMADHVTDILKIALDK